MLLFVTDVGAGNSGQALILYTSSGNKNGYLGMLTEPTYYVNVVPFRS